MKNKILYIIGGKNFKFNTHIEKNSKVIFFDKYQEGFINQLFLIKEFAKNQNSLQNKWLEFQESVFKNIKLFIDRDEDYQYLLTNLFFEGSVYKTNSIYNFFKLYLIIDLIKDESIENITLIDAVDLIEHNGNKVIEYHYSLVDYMAEYTRGKLKTGNDVIDAKWVSINELKAYNLWIETTNVIKTAYKMRKKNVPDKPLYHSLCGVLS